MTNVSAINTAYVQDALKYVNGMSISEAKITDDIFGAFKSVPSFGLIQGGLFAGGRILSRTPVLDAAGDVVMKDGKEVLKFAGIKGLTGSVSTLKEVMTGSSAVVDIVKSSKGLKNAAANYDMVMAVKDLVKAGKSADEISSILKGATSNTEAIKLAKDALGTASKATETVAKVSRLSRLGKWVAGTAPAQWLANSALGTATKSFFSKGVGKSIAEGAGKFSKTFKSSGAGISLAIEGAMALITDVIPAFKMGGFKEGVKQTAKSAVKVGASTTGWVVGSSAGKAVGSFLGSLIPVPVVGTAVGGFIGSLVGGLIGSSVAGKVAEKVVGPDYTDKVQEQAIAEQGNMLAQDPSSMAQLNAAVQEMLQADMADDGKLSKDGEKMLAYLQQGAGTVSNYQTQYLNQVPFTSQYNSQYASNPYQTAQYASNYQTGSDLDQLIYRVKSGDMSVYDVPADVLAKSAKNYTSTTEGFANNYTSFGMQNPYAQTSGTGGTKTINYYEA